MDGFKINQCVLDAKEMNQRSRNIERIGPGINSPADDTLPEKIGSCFKFWPEEVAAMPTDFTRVALFSIIRSGRRKFLNNIRLEGRADIQIYFTGYQLDQADADLYLACLRMGRGIEMGRRMAFVRNRLLKEMKRSVGKASYLWVNDALDRLCKASLRVEITKRNGRKVRASCHLMSSGLDEDTGQMYVRIDPESAALFGDDNLAYVNWDIRLSLSLKMSKSVQMYVSGHTAGKQHSVSLEDLRRWTGYDGRLRDFRVSLLSAFEELQKNKVISNAIVKDGLKGDTARWDRPPTSKSQ